MKTGMKALLTGIGIGIGAVGLKTVQRKLVDVMTGLAMERKLPPKISKGQTKASGSEEHSEKMEEVKALALRLEEQASETVTITADDGIHLVGHIYNAKSPKRIILAMHGWRSAWNRDFCGIASFWHENDCSVLYAEQRGQNASGGDYMGFGPLERFDCF